ncbi:MAG: flagellar biosynthetic protein FliQ [Candidatus Eremiobacteraeota bacterium]|nr:flagellar biosynthetic protein FliQ [Candidatus Eremiobacteraeota bacterium]MBV9973579.1 flagellar biosynthetic protein FliQ [Candidatus Eremiobacteraeota bacterium]
MEAFDRLLRESLLVAAFLCLPVLFIATAVGTLVALIQAATQVQEQTLSLLPKLISVGAALALFGGYGMHLCAGLFLDAVAQIADIVHGV